MKKSVNMTAVALSILFVPTIALGCGSDSACEVGERHYRAYVPAVAKGDLPALVFAHGFRGSDEGTMRNRSLRKWADENGVAIIALKSAALDWDIPFAPRTYESDGKAEEAYIEDVLADATNRFDIDPDQIVMSGFSAGGMVTWHMACHRPDLFAGFVPMAGTFWLQTPDSCSLPVRSLVHIHGSEDNVVPFEGRQIRNTHQGSIFEALDLYRDAGNFSGSHAQNMGDLTCSVEGNSEGAVLGFCQFPGGHDFRVDYLDYGWRRVLR